MRADVELLRADKVVVPMSPSAALRRPRPSLAGFTALETLIVMAIIGVIAAIGLPALMTMIRRGKLEGSALETAAMIRLARFEAIKRAVPAGVRVSYADQMVIRFIDTELNCSDAAAPCNPDDATVTEVGYYPLPRGVQFKGPSDVADGADAIDGFEQAPVGDPLEGGWILFEPDGSARTVGAFRFGNTDKIEPIGNYLEVRVAPRATAKVTLRKWDGSEWQEGGEGADLWDWY